MVSPDWWSVTRLYGHNLHIQCHRSCWLFPSPKKDQPTNQTMSPRSSDGWTEMPNKHHRCSILSYLLLTLDRTPKGKGYVILYGFNFRSQLSSNDMQQSIFITSASANQSLFYKLNSILFFQLNLIIKIRKPKSKLQNVKTKRLQMTMKISSYPKRPKIAANPD